MISDHLNRKAKIQEQTCQYYMGTAAGDDLISLWKENT